MTFSKGGAVALMAAAGLQLIVSAGCATQPSLDQRIQALEPLLIARGDADSLATAAALRRAAHDQREDALVLAARATAAAPDRPDLAMVQLMLCQQTAACDPQPLELRLRQLDPANGISWLYTLARATAAHDEPGVRVALSGLAQSQRVDEYWTERVSHMTAAVAGRGGFDLNSAFVAVVGVNAAMVMPALQPVSAACSQGAVSEAGVLEQCRRISTALDRADTMLLASLGNRMAARLWPAGSTQRARIDAERRTLDYRLELWTHNAEQLNSTQASRALADLYSKYASEQDALKAWYIELGVTPDPPPDWKPHPPGS